MRRGDKKMNEKELGQFVGALCGLAGVIFTCFVDWHVGFALIGMGIIFELGSL